MFVTLTVFPLPVPPHPSVSRPCDIVARSLVLASLPSLPQTPLPKNSLRSSHPPLENGSETVPRTGVHTRTAHGARRRERLRPVPERRTVTRRTTQTDICLYPTAELPRLRISFLEPSHVVLLWPYTLWHTNQPINQPSLRHNTTRSLLLFVCVCVCCVFFLLIPDRPTDGQTDRTAERDTDNDTTLLFFFFERDRER